MMYFHPSPLLRRVVLHTQQFNSQLSFSFTFIYSDYYKQQLMLRISSLILNLENKMRPTKAKETQTLYVPTLLQLSQDLLYFLSLFPDFLFMSCTMRTHYQHLIMNSGHVYLSYGFWKNEVLLARLP